MPPEIQSYLERIEDLRSQIRSLIESLPTSDLPEALNWRPIDVGDNASGGHATNSLGVMALHAAGAEHFWMGEVIGGMPHTRDRDSEFVSQIENVNIILERLNIVGAETRTVMAWLNPVNLDETRLARGKLIPVRWMILHVIDHTALHLGHMQLTYQLWMGGKAGKAAKSPRWFERTPQK
jgi:hypothetical protein